MLTEQIFRVEDYEDWIAPIQRKDDHLTYKDGHVVSIIAESPDGTIQAFKNVKQAAAATNVHSASIHSALNGKRSNAGGLTWRLRKIENEETK